MSRVYTHRLTALAALSAILLFSACGKKASEDTASADAHPTLDSALSKEAVELAQKNALPKADANTPQKSYRNIESGNDLMFIYYALSSVPPEMTRIASFYSEEYRGSSDAFRKSDILKGLEPRIQQELAKAKSERYFTYEISQSLEHYDLTRKDFRLKSELSGHSWSSSDNREYKLRLSNGDAITAIKVEDEALARSIEQNVDRYNAHSLKLYLFAQDADPSKSTVKAQIVMATLMDDKGRELITVKP